jgi:hypothetical protein
MHTQTQELLDAAVPLADTLSQVRDLFHALCKQVDPVLSRINREAEEALVDETEPTLRAMLDGRVCQRARAANTHLLNARRELAALIAATTELARDITEMSEPTA